MLEASALLLLLLVAMVPRLYDPEGPRSTFPDLFDEGIRTEQLMLMAAGYRPFKDIYSSQGVLLLDLLFPMYMLLGQTLGAARIAVGLLSIVGAAGAWWSVRQVSGAIGGLAATFLLVFSVPFLEGSTLALAEVPSLAPCLWAVGCALRWQRGSRPRWLYAAAALATIGVLIKPMAITVVVPVGLLAVLRPRVRWRQLAIAALVGLGISVLIVAVQGPSQVYQQIYAFRSGAREAADWQPRRNFKLAVTEPFRDQPGLYILAGASAALLVTRSWRRGLALAAWPLAASALLVAYYPLHPKHLVYLVPPLAVLAGAGVGRAARLAWNEAMPGRGTRLLSVAIALMLAALPLGLMPDLVSSTPRAIDQSQEDEDRDLHVFDQAAARAIASLTQPGEFILTDHPFLAALARRLVPPNLVDPSRGRTRAGVLTDRDVLEAASQFDTRLVLVWADRLRRLPGVPPWLDREYQVAQAFGNRDVKSARAAKDRALYLRKDDDFGAARIALESTLGVHETAELGGKLRLLGASVEPPVLSRTDQFTVTLGWEALTRLPADLKVTVDLQNEAGEDHQADAETDLEGTVKPTPIWEAGHWFFHTLALELEADAPVGTYRVEVMVSEPRDGQPLAIVVPSTNVIVKSGKDGRLIVGTLEVR